MTFWEIISTKMVKIPAIQRDYAQGRLEQNKLAIEFLTELRKHIVSSDEIPLHLDFVYGRINDNNELVLLDGQQRLTTLFLLHWYLSYGKLSEEQKNILAKFKYATRTNPEDFCFKLVKEDLEKEENIRLTNGEEHTIRKRIIQSKWFYLSWERDPTVSAMLNMLDHIENIFGKPDFALFKRLTDENNSPVTFEFLPLEKFGLEDELYIKMNARGKPLTNFENFKAKFSELVDDEIKIRLDNDWLDIFWNFERKSEKPSSKATDEKYFNFFHNITLCFYLETKSIEKIEDFDLFEKYNDVYSDPVYLKNVSAILDALIHFDDSNNYFYNILISEPTYWDRARFYALSCFFIKHGQVDSKNKYIFNRWMRICRNLINNTILDGIDLLGNSIKAIKKLTKHMDLIYEYFFSFKLNDKKLPIEFFDKAQQSEEVIKADLLLNKTQIWESLIHGIEKNTYFDGQIGFILRFSQKINTTYDDKAFSKYSKILNELFGIYKEKFGFLFQRSLFTFGDYLAPFSSAKSFCTFDEGLRAKNDHWRKVFDDNEKSEYLKKLLISIDEDNIKKSLQKNIDSYEYDEKDWKSHFIKDDKGVILSYCKNGQIRILEGEIVTLSRGGNYNQKWSKCAELYTYIYYLRNLRVNEDNLKPFTHTDYYESTHPCAFIDTWSDNKYEDYDLTMDIYHDSKGYSLDVNDRNGNSLPSAIKKSLKENDFEKNGISYILYLSEMSFAKLDKIIHKILKSL